MKIAGIAPWYGSKRTMAPMIVEELGPHNYYFGICCGSLSVEFAKEPSHHETVCDLHGDLINLAWVLQVENSAVRLYNRCQRTNYCDSRREHFFKGKVMSRKAIEIKTTLIALWERLGNEGQECVSMLVDSQCEAMKHVVAELEPDEVMERKAAQFTSLLILYGFASLIESVKRKGS